MGFIYISGDLPIHLGFFFPAFFGCFFRWTCWGGSGSETSGSPAGGRNGKQNLPTHPTLWVSCWMASCKWCLRLRFFWGGSWNYETWEEKNSFMGKSSPFILRDLGGATVCDGYSIGTCLAFFAWTTINCRKLEEMEIWRWMDEWRCSVHRWLHFL